MTTSPTLSAYERQLARTAEYSRKRTAAGAEIGILPSVVNSRRKKKASKDLGYFLRTYFPAAFNLKFSPAHKEVIKLVQQAVLDGGLFAVAMPRSSGKSAILLRALIWSALYAHHRFLFLIAANEQMSKSLLASFKSEIENNPLLYEDFPEIAHAVRALECLGSA